MHAETVPFCQRNIRLWLTLLGVTSAVVLGYSIWLAARGNGLQAHHTYHAIVGKGSHAAVPPIGPQPVDPQLAPVAAPMPAPMGVGLRLVAQQTVVAGPMDLQSAFNRAADIIRPAVVNINAVRLGPPQMLNGSPNAPRFVDPFDGVPDKVFGNVRYESVGSGVIIDPRGYVVTNDHLVSGATSFVITRFNAANAHLSARLIISDRMSDLALIKLEGDGPFPVATLADSSRVEVGDWVLAVGNPFGLGHTVTAGIISGRRTSLVISGVEYRGLLQTDAPINQGSSGGPLVNLSGQVVGINTAIYAPTGVFNGTGFAIPANRVGAFISTQLPDATAPLLGAAAVSVSPAASVSVSPWVGMSVIDVTPELAAKLGLPGASGAFVTSVAPGSPAADSEIARGDVIVALNGQVITGSATLANALRQATVGQLVPVLVWRSGTVKTLQLRVLAQMGITP